MTKESKRSKRIDPRSSEWERRANRLARDFCPRIYPCGACGEPVVYGYCCRSCGSDSPGEEA